MICYEILNCGKGERGCSVEIVGCVTPEGAAAEAAQYFDDIECGDPELIGQWDNTHHHIEVANHGKFLTFCEVRRHYSARQEI